MLRIPLALPSWIATCSEEAWESVCSIGPSGDCYQSDWETPWRDQLCFTVKDPESQRGELVPNHMVNKWQSPGLQRCLSFCVLGASPNSTTAPACSFRASQWPWEMLVAGVCPCPAWLLVFPRPTCFTVVSLMAESSCLSVLIPHNPLFFLCSDWKWIFSLVYHVQTVSTKLAFCLSLQY